MQSMAVEKMKIWYNSHISLDFSLFSDTMRFQKTFVEVLRSCRTDNFGVNWLESKAFRKRTRTRKKNGLPHWNLLGLVKHNLPFQLRFPMFWCNSVKLCKDLKFVT